MITAEEHRANLIAQAFGRETEVYNYQANIDGYAGMLAALPEGEWPEALAAYAGIPTDALPHDLSDVDVDAIEDYKLRDRLRGLVRTERSQQNIARRALDVLKLQIGEGYDAAIAAYKESRANASPSA